MSLTFGRDEHFWKYEGGGNSPLRISVPAPWHYGATIFRHRSVMPGLWLALPYTARQWHVCHCRVFAKGLFYSGTLMRDEISNLGILWLLMLTFCFCWATRVFPFWSNIVRIWFSSFRSSTFITVFVFLLKQIIWNCTFYMFKFLVVFAAWALG